MLRVKGNKEFMLSRHNPYQICKCHYCLYQPTSCVHVKTFLFYFKYSSTPKSNFTVHVFHIMNPLFLFMKGLFFYLSLYTKGISKVRLVVYLHTCREHGSILIQIIMIMMTSSVARPKATPRSCTLLHYSSARYMIPF